MCVCVAVPAFEGEENAQEDDDKHEDSRNDACHLYSAVHLFFRLYVIGILGRCTFKATSTSQKRRKGL